MQSFSLLKQVVHTVTTRLEGVLKEDNLLNKHQGIFSVHKSGVQLMNNPTEFIATKRRAYVNFAGLREGREKGTMRDGMLKGTPFPKS
jgi:hypothetical protein